MAKVTLNHKRGATFSWAGTAALPAGTWTAHAHIETTSGTLIENLTVTLAAPVAPATAHTIAITATSAASALWPLGSAVMDIKYTSSGGTVLYSPTCIVKIEAEVTE